MSVFDYLAGHRVVRILLPVKDSQPLPRECVAHGKSAPYFEVIFLPGQLPVNLLEAGGKCQVSFFADGRPHLVNASLEEIVDGTKLRLKAVEVVAQLQQRENFRVDTELSLTYRRLVQGNVAPLQSVSATVNLSGGGIWFPVREELALKEKLALEITLNPSTELSVPALGQVVRLTQVRKGPKGVAVQFTDIASGDRDRIIAFCFAEQRKKLRNRIRVLESE